MPKKSYTVNEGEVYAIPLFVSDESRLTRFSKEDLDKEGGRFAFMRVVTDRGGSGVIIDVFDLVGLLNTPVEKIIAAPRLFPPVATTTLAMHKKRWPLIGHQQGYDKERDSQYSSIGLVMFPPKGPVLWLGGVKSSITKEEAEKYEPWVMWGANQIEKRILETLNARGEPEP